METPGEADQGYPEEARAEVAGDESSGPQEGGRDKQAEDDAPDDQDGTATGNRNAAG